MNQGDFISKDKRRPRTTVNGKTMYRSNVLWNRRHSDDPVLKGEIVHHMDGDPFNDEPGNHEKMTKKKHDALHRPALIRSHVKALKGTKQSKEQIEKRMARIRGTRKWDLTEARELKSKGLSLAAIESHFGVSHGTLYHWCKRNGEQL